MLNAEPLLFENAVYLEGAALGAGDVDDDGAGRKLRRRRMLRFAGDEGLQL